MTHVITELAISFQTEESAITLVATKLTITTNPDSCKYLQKEKVNYVLNCFLCSGHINIPVILHRILSINIAQLCQASTSDHTRQHQVSQYICDRRPLPTMQYARHNLAAVPYSTYHYDYARGAPWAHAPFVPQVHCDPFMLLKQQPQRHENEGWTILQASKSSGTPPLSRCAQETGEHKHEWQCNRRSKPTQTATTHIHTPRSPGHRSFSFLFAYEGSERVKLTKSARISYIFQYAKTSHFVLASSTPSETSYAASCQQAGLSFPDEKRLGTAKHLKF